MRTTSNYVLFELALTNLGVGLSFIHCIYWRYIELTKKKIPDCKIVTAHSISTTFFAGVSLLYITFIGIIRDTRH